MKSVLRTLFLTILFLSVGALITSHTLLAANVYVVPKGNRNKHQPKIPQASKNRTKAFKSNYEKKYESVRALLENDKNLITKIKKISKKYKIAPIHMVGALVGEHTYNIDAYDHLQTYYVKAASYVRSAFRFQYKGEGIEEFVKRPEFEPCKDFKESYDLWTCRQNIWKTKFSGKKVDGRKFPKDRFSSVFFQPFYSGQTFGLGQVSPLTALKLTDLVHKTSGYAKLKETDAAGVYKAIMNPDISLTYVAAIIRKSIDDYRSFAKMDISKNPGITATLFNLGNTRDHAKELAKKNRRYGRILPKENYYGWLINNKQKELQALLDGKPNQVAQSKKK